MASLRQAVRRFATYAERLQAKQTAAEGKAKAFMGISLFVGIPMVFLSAYNAWKLESEHHHHIEEHGRPPFVAYPHLRRRSKPFPWGDGNHSLLHNPETNPLPEGYEDDL